MPTSDAAKSLPYNLPYGLPHKLLYNLPFNLLYNLPPRCALDRENCTSAGWSRGPVRADYFSMTPTEGDVVRNTSHHPSSTSVQQRLQVPPLRQVTLLVAALVALPVALLVAAQVAPLVAPEPAASSMKPQTAGSVEEGGPRRLLPCRGVLAKHGPDAGVRRGTRTTLPPRVGNASHALWRGQKGQRPAPARRYRGDDATRRQEPAMSDHEQQPAADHQPVTPKGADALRAYAARTRSSADQLATYLEEVAVNGQPTPENTTPWEVVRDRRLAELAEQRGHVA